jgi:glucosamine-6-phosphate deaminase
VATIRVVAAPDEERVHRQVATLLLAAVIERPDLVLSVFAGTPAFALYRQLTERAASEGVDFSRVRFVVFDELVRSGAPFHAVLQERLFGPLAVPPENVIAFDPGAERAAEVARIRAWLRVAGIAVALLSVDSRGHIGFHVATDAGPPAAAAAVGGSSAGILPVENRDRWGTAEAFSLGLDDVARSGRVLLFACGKNLAAIVQQLVEGAFEPGRPISILQRHERVTLAADRAALSEANRTDRLTGQHGGLYILDSSDPPRGRRVLVVSPHPDDASISAGGLMALLAPHNRLVTAVMSTGHRSFIPATQRADRIALREREVTEESRLLGSEPRFLRLPFYDANYEVGDRDREIFGALVAEVEPDWVLLPHAGDPHPAHVASRRVALEVLGGAARGTARRVQLWSYEGPWALFGRGGFDAIVPVPRPFFEQKVAAIRAHRSQVERTPYDVAAESLARMRAALVPESELAGFGARPPRLEPYVELYRQESGGAVALAPGAAEP